MTTQKSILEAARSLAASRSRAHRTLSLWLFGEVAYAILPIAVLAIITRALGGSFSEFGLIKEWSFASIVLFGAAIRRLIRLKVEVQNTPKSYKLDTGVQIQIIFLIIAVLILALVILYERGRLAGINTLVLGGLQLSFFALSVTSVLIMVFGEEFETPLAYLREGGIPTSSAYRIIDGELERLVSGMYYSTYLVRRAAATNFRLATDRIREDVELPRACAALDLHVKQLLELANELRSGVEVLSTKPREPDDSPPPI